MKKRTQLNKLEQQLLVSEVGGEETPQVAICSATPIDTGRWWRRSPAWICVMSNELVMLAAAKRNYIEKVAIDQCGESFYSHATGEIVIAPINSLSLNRFEVTPGEAIRLLNFLKIKP